MSEQPSYGMRSLRFKLIFASIAVEAVMLSVLVWNSTRITGDAIQETFQDQLETLIPVMVVGLTTPLVQRDYATLDERLGKMVNSESLVYLELRDELGKILASRGAVPEAVHFDTSFEVSDHVYDQTFDIVLAGQLIGRARYGLNISQMEATVKDLRDQGVLVASAEIGLTIALLITLGALLTNHLRALAQAALTLASGNYDVRVPVVGRDEVADTAIAFNAMADTLARDIVERKQAERTLKESEERFRATFEQAAVGIAQVAPDGRWSHVNQKLCDIVGYSREELLQRSFQDITHPADLEADLGFIRQLLAGEIQTYSMEKRYLRKDRSLVWIYLTVGLVRQPTGEPKYFISVIEDISERKRTETALQQSEQRLRNIIDGLGPSMFVGLLTTEGVVLEANQQALAAAGLKPEDVLGKPIEETYWFSYSEESKRQMRATVTRAARGEASRYDLQIRATETQFIPLDFSVQPFRDAAGQVVLLVPSAIVIAERKQAEAKLHENEERLRLALDAAHMGTFDWDIPHNHVTWSRGHEELWGFRPGEFDGTFEAFAQRLHPDDLPGIDAEVARCIATCEPFVHEFRVVWPDGSVHWISGRGEFTFGADNEPQRMRGAVVEITERKQAEAALLDAKENLEHKVVERTAELQAIQLELHAKNEELIKQNRRVEEANRLKSEFLANMSHELRTPLNAIIGFSELMHDGKVGPIADNHKEYLGDVLTSSRHLLHLINDVLDLAKVESGKMEFHYAPMDLRKVIGEVCEILRTMTSRTRVQVAIDIDKGLSEVWGDASKLKQVLYNYLSNALKFSPEGGQVRVRARCEGRDAYRIDVEDQGIGIKTEDIPRLFQEFQQLDLSASKKYQGTGLGLALTKRIIEAQGGCVGVESKRGHGSIFYAILPLRNADIESALSLSAPGV